MLFAFAAVTAAALPPVPRSDYKPVAGDGFFLLSDASFGSKEVAKVRLEVPAENAGGNLRNYGGVDIVVYRVPKPIEFLAAQKNLHRVNVKGSYVGEGLANTLSYLWDSWYKQARRSWQRVLATPARQAAVSVAPEFKMGDAMSAPTQFENNSQFKPLTAFPVIEQFRYPLWQAKTIQPPSNTVLSGSSSNFITPSEGDVMVPLGRLKPGLYLVEAIIGSHRANTLLFVSDTIAVTKNASDQMVVWAANRIDGRPVAKVAARWTDGAGVLMSGTTDSNGLMLLGRTSPEHTYVFGQDPLGGVFVSENYYYDSEIYNTKLYAVTDRPLYRPGDQVDIKVFAREFKSARVSVPVAASNLSMTVLDPSGTPVATSSFRFSPQDGGQTRFRLPDNATAGGYEVRIGRGDDLYAAAFRVAQYVKPHFDINLLLDKSSYKTGEAIHGHISLRYPDGKPVANAHVTVNVRAQQSSMVEGELRYAGLFPVKLDQQELTSDSAGNVDLTMPSAKLPSRYVVTILANDDVAYRVRVTRELLIERGITEYMVESEKRFSEPGDTATFKLTTQGPAKSAPSSWEVIRLEDRARTTGTLVPGAQSFPVTFSEPGSYTVNIRDAAGELLGAASHWVAGNGLKAAPGKIEIVFDKSQYEPGETARALITFPEPVDQALLTLERDRVEQHAMLAGAKWVKTTRVGPMQWRADIKVSQEQAPNMTFSVLYVKHGDYVFENAGIKVVQPSVVLSFSTSKQVYSPGDIVTVDVRSDVNGKPVSADVAVGVVDDLIYVLQPEIAPNIFDFFYHPRRDNVRTTVSLNFIGYDLARAYGAADMRRNEGANERSVKVLERPRRENVDTAAWQPTLHTDATGHARFSFVMPDSLTRWRITGRAMTANGLVGQHTAYIRSNKALYVKWTGPTHFREQDKPQVALVVFNETAQSQTAQLDVAGAGVKQHTSLTLKQGANYVVLPVDRIVDGDVDIKLSQGGRVVDHLATHIGKVALAWASPHQINQPLSAGGAMLKLPPDAHDLSVRLISGANAQFQRVVDELIDYPFGCIEQTASRLIPLVLAREAMGDGVDAMQLNQRLHTERLRLVQLAGNDGVFGWWGWMSQDNLFLSAYAYYADWYAGRALGITLPDEHWQRLLDLYQKHVTETPILQRALVLWWMNQIGLPVGTLLDALDTDLAAASKGSVARLGAQDSITFVAPVSLQSWQLSLLLSSNMHSALKTSMVPSLAEQVNAAAVALRGDPSSFVQSLLLMDGMATAGLRPAEVLANVSEDGPTLERAMTLVWLQKAMGGTPADVRVSNRLRGAWHTTASASGAALWHWDGPLPPDSLKFAPAPPAGMMAELRYDSAAQEQSKLPLQLTRRLYRLVPGKDALSFTAEPMTEGDALTADALYVDEVTLVPRGGKSDYSYGLLEVPLPPGGSVESTSWGLQISGLPDAGTGTRANSGAQANEGGFRRPTYEMGDLSYHVPFEHIGGPQVVRQLVRFSQRGTFVLPPARFFRMYQPEDKAYEAQTTRVITVQ